MYERKRYSDENGSADDGHYWISVSDLMTSLLFIFIILLAYNILTLSKKTAVFEESFESRGKLLREVQTTLKEKSIDVDVDQKNGNMRIRSDGFFNTASAELSDDGRRKMVIIAEVIKDRWQANAKFRDSIDTIFIEGHTDNVGERPANMKLSAQRAINTFTTMDNDTHIGEMLNRDKKPLFSFSGYADWRPINDNRTEPGRTFNSTELGRQQNRRIEFFFALTSPQLNIQK